MSMVRAQPPAETSARQPVRPSGRSAWAGSMWVGLQDRALALTVLLLTASAVLGASMLNAPEILVLAIAAAPLLAIVGVRHALVVLPVVVAVRAIVDTVGLVATGGIAVGIIGLALLVSWRSATSLLVLFATSGYLLISAAAGAGTYGATTTYGEALRLLSLLAVVLVVMNAPGRLSGAGIARSMQLVGVVPAVVAIYQLVTGTGTHIDGLLRAAGTLAQSNPASALFALSNLACFVLLLARAQRLGPNLALFALFLTAQFATGTISGAVTCLVMVVMHLITLRHATIERVAWILAGIALVAYLAATSDLGTSRLGEFTGANAAPLSGENSLGWRIEAWSKVLAAWREHPTFGNGVGAAQAGIILVDNIPHNEYVRILAEMGIVGLTLAGVGALVFGLRMRRAVSLTEDFAPSLALAVLTGTLVNMVAANTLLYSTSFYLTLFILAGCWRVVRDREPDARISG